MGKALSIVVACALLASASAAAATTPTSYRAQVNGICRVYVPLIKQNQEIAAAAQNASNEDAVGIALGYLQRYMLALDGHIEAVAVPSTMRTQMAPILSILKKVDSQIQAGVAKLLAGDAKSWAAHLESVSRLGQPLNAMFTAAGLRDCTYGA